MGYVFTGTNFRWDVLFIALTILIKGDQSSLADFLAFTGDAVSSLISFRSLFK